MKKIILLLALITFLNSGAYAQSDNIALLEQKGFFEKPAVSYLSSCEEIKRTLYQHLKYSNTYNYEGLKLLYADNYVNSDGFTKDIYFELIKKTWASYPDIKYKLEIKSIEINQDTAIATVNETAVGTTSSKSGVVNEKGILESSSSSIYYLEKINNRWLIVSDHINSEKTSLRYGSAKEMEINFSAPMQIPANTSYTQTLKINAPKDCIIIASIGKENITYPQNIAEEVFRKLPEDGVLERVFTSNDKNINEYAVASYGVTKAQINGGTEIKIYVTGIGFVMSRVNVIPKNQFVKADTDEKK